MLTLLSAAVALASLTASTPPQTWYGPATVEFQVQWPGNPYDPEQNDVRVVFTGSRGEKVERLAYFDRGSWRASLVAPNGGRYRPVLLRNGATSIQEAVPPVVELKEKMAFGFVRNDEIAANRFRSDNGTRLFLFGVKAPGTEEGVDRAAKAGANWIDSRVAVQPWPAADEFTFGDHLSRKALEELDTWVSALASVNIRFTFHLLNMRAFENQEVWARHSWNKANGGFLSSQADFFRDPEARRRTRMWIRYAVSRWGHLENLASWSLLDAEPSASAPDQGAWAAEMTEYLTSLDPAKRSVVNANGFAQGGPALASLATSESSDVHESVWGALLQNQAGVVFDSPSPELKLWSEIVSEAGLANRPSARRIQVTLGKGSSASALAESDWLMVRLKSGSSLQLSATALASGEYAVRTFSLTDGSRRDGEATVKDFQAVLPGPITGDVVVVLTRRG